MVWSIIICKNENSEIYPKLLLVGKIGSSAIIKSGHSQGTTNTKCSISKHKSANLMKIFFICWQGLDNEENWQNSEKWGKFSGKWTFENSKILLRHTSRDQISSLKASTI